MRALVTGATGFVGRHLLAQLERPIVLSRDGARAERLLAEYAVRAFSWDAQNEPAPAQAFEDVEVVFHLAGEPVAQGRWTRAKKARLRDSRVTGTRNLVRTLAKLEHKPRTLISASAVGYYSDRGDETLDESASPGKDFLAEICVAWEEESQKAADAGIRVVNLRIGIVLGSGGGALAKMLTPFKFGLGSSLGHGRQWMSWIHLDDLIGIMLFAARCDQIRGPINATAPNPVTNRQFTKALGKALRRPTVLPSVPGIVLRLGMGEFASVLLASQKAIPRAAQAAGYEFVHSQLEEALQDILD
ncbi:MAG: TIGR01777 family protein [Planctomycetes bacterium]|nr:TIGR01777 family protein [Planctomycetota bacterium]MBL7044908.1 TIGR01777 family protein [Pirellulaceae bacterium]